MRNSILALVTGAALLASTGAALADSSFAPSKRVAPLPGGHYLCDVAFGSGQTAISTVGSDELDHASDAMKTNDDALVILDAHTDARGSAQVNNVLALQRAEAVKDGLVARGIDPDRILIAVYGENTAKGRVGANERRVDLWMTYTVSVQQIVDRTLAQGDAVIWTKVLSQAEIERRPRLYADRAPVKSAPATPRLTASR